MSSSTHSKKLPKCIGFIGLGAMGKPMAVNLAKSLPSGSQIYAHDAVNMPVDELYRSFPDMIVKCTSAREVAESSVGAITKNFFPSFLCHPEIHF